MAPSPKKAKNVESSAKRNVTCRTCELNAVLSTSTGGVILQTHHWRLEHIIEPIPMLGWLILKPMRHVEAFADLSEEEAAACGGLIRRITRAMMNVLNPEKIYLSMFMEAEGFAHLHVHLIPRSEAVPQPLRGPSIFSYLKQSTREGRNLARPEDARKLADSIRSHLNGSDSESDACV